ncbi:MAG: hypothetical protein K6G80_01580 [Treponema sp.]|nr:hypothetical protein [Treponema sp.]
MKDLLLYELISTDELVSCIRRLSIEEKQSLGVLCAFIIERSAVAKREGLLALDDANDEPADIRAHFMTDEACYLFWFGTRLVLDGKSGEDLWLMLHAQYRASCRECCKEGDALFNAELALSAYGVWLVSQCFLLEELLHRLLVLFPVSDAGIMFAAILDAAVKTPWRKFFNPESILPQSLWKPHIKKRVKLSKPKEPRLEDILAALSDEDKKNAYVQIGGRQFFPEKFSAEDYNICSFTKELPDLATASDKNGAITLPLEDGIRLLYSLRPSFGFFGYGSNQLKESMLKRNRALKALLELCDVLTYYTGGDDRYTEEERTWRESLNAKVRATLTQEEIECYLFRACFPKPDYSERLKELYMASERGISETYRLSEMRKTWLDAMLQLRGSANGK